MPILCDPPPTALDAPIQVICSPWPGKIPAPLLLGIRSFNGIHCSCICYLLQVVRKGVFPVTTATALTPIVLILCWFATGTVTATELALMK